MSQEDQQTSAPAIAPATPSTTDPGPSNTAAVITSTTGGPVPPSMTPASMSSVPVTPASSSSMIYATPGSTPSGPAGPGPSTSTTSDAPTPTQKPTVASSFISTITSTLASIPTSIPSGNYPPTLDAILSQITSATHVKLHSLSHTLRNGLPKESRDAILAGILPGGQDPLGALDVRHNTLGVLWILSARLTVHDAAPPLPAFILDFCRYFNPEQARMAPDRVTLLARGIVRYAALANNDAWAIEPLYHLVTRYPPDGSYLTTIHPVFVLSCVATRHFTIALPVLQVPITNIDPSLSDLTYHDNLKYHYIGGIALAALRRWDEAEDFFEICIASPAVVPSAVQLEALKKLKLVQLIARGKTSPLPRYAHQGLSRALKNTPYQMFINVYSRSPEQLRIIMEEHRQLFATERNLGLILQAVRRAPRWMLKKLTATYLTLGLADIAKAIKVESEIEVRNLILNMIEAKDISARISADGTVTFFDATPEYSKDDLVKLLQDIQNQGEHLSYLDRETSKDKEYLKKALKQKDDSGWAGPLDDDLFSGSGPGGGGSSSWVDFEP